LLLILLKENIPGKINRYFPFSFSIFGVTTADLANCISRPLHICCSSEPGRNADALVGKVGGVDVTGRFLDKIIGLIDDDDDVDNVPGGGFFLFLDDDDEFVFVFDCRTTFTFFFVIVDVDVDDDTDVTLFFVCGFTKVRLFLVADGLLEDGFGGNFFELVVDDGAIFENYTLNNINIQVEMLKLRK